MLMPGTALEPLEIREETMWNPTEPRTTQRLATLSAPLAETLDDIQPPARTWWLRLASSSARNPQRTLEERDAARRSDLIAWLSLGMLGSVAILSPIAIDDLRALITYAGFVLGIFLVLALNRQGIIRVAGVLLVVLIGGAMFGATLASPIGLTMGQLPNYDLLAVAVVVAATVLPRAFAFVVAGLDSVAIIADYLLQPHNQNIVVDARLYSSATQQTISLLVRPIALQFVLAVVAFLWVRGMDLAVRRADRAEEIAVLEHREHERTIALEEGVRYLHQVLAEWVTGDLRRRIPNMPVAALKQVRDDLNTFVERLDPIMRAEYQLQRVHAEAVRLTSSLEEWMLGHPPVWPHPSGTVLDRAVEIVQIMGSGRSDQPTPTQPSIWSEPPRPSGPHRPSGGPRFPSSPPAQLQATDSPAPDDLRPSPWRDPWDDDKTS
jgi:hypothetical protein